MNTVNNIKKVKNDFWIAFYSVPAFKINDLQSEIMEKLEWSRSTLYSKRNGNRKIRNPERIMLKSIFKKYGIEFKAA